MFNEQNPHKLEVYNELKRRKKLVGTLEYLSEDKRFRFTYQRRWLTSKQAIPLGPELGVNQLTHISEVEKLFPSFLDRIPDPDNPAYEEYCQQAGITPDEKNPIVLLTTIGRRGPSTFTFEPVFLDNRAKIVEDLKELIKELHLSTWDIAKAFGISQLTVQRILKDEVRQSPAFRLLEVFLRFPDVALQQLRESGRLLPDATRTRIWKYFSNRKGDII